MNIFTEKDIKKIISCLKPYSVTRERDHFHLSLLNEKEKRKVDLAIYPEANLGKNRGSMVVIYAGNCHLQLHSCSGYVISEELGEVTFIGENGGKLAGLVVEKEAACALYANVNRKLISEDFTKLGVEVMLSGVALSLAEDILKKGDKN